ncbi:twin-arginine translocase TatA/TatE family subunit [Gulosibacter sediminis]|uniref:twin-arginine translocase TatA/TatE family subunit n=1 Tax=Gulosibacter sediminis TaxID=1729695 RepID=UPI0024AE58E9|nr:twin-arginine translocase TatA/TatE family subunit [Gulosibacter sediminis]
MGGLTFEKLLVIAVIAMFIFGPDRLPGLAEGAAKLVKRARHWVDDTKQRVSDEMGTDFTEEDWRKLDPRQYDPRRIVRDAWNDAGPTASSGATAGAATAVAVGTASTASAATADSAPSWASSLGASASAEHLVPGMAPFDNEAT